MDEASLSLLWDVWDLIKFHTSVLCHVFYDIHSPFYDLAWLSELCIISNLLQFDWFRSFLDNTVFRPVWDNGGDIVCDHPVSIG